MQIRIIIITLLIITSPVMAQEAFPDTLVLKTGPRYQVRYIDVREGLVFIEKDGINKSMVQGVPVRLIEKIILFDGTVMEGAEIEMVAAASKERTQIVASTATAQQEGFITVNDLGVALIIVSGVIGYINNNKECDDCVTLDDLDSFSDDLKGTANIQYSALAAGAILMLIDRERTKKIVTTVGNK